MQQKLICISEAARKISAHVGRQISPSGVRRWTIKGVADPRHKGRRVCLETTRVGGRVYTTGEWVDAFLRQCSGKEARERKQKRRPTGEESPARKLLREKYGFRYDDST